MGLDHSIGSPFAGPTQPSLSLRTASRTSWGLSAHLRWNVALDPKRSWQEYGHWPSAWWTQTGSLRARWLQLDWLPGTYQAGPIRGALGLSLGVGRQVYYVPATPPDPLIERAFMVRPSMSLSSEVARWTLRCSWSLEFSPPPESMEPLLPKAQLHLGLALQYQIPPPYKKR